MKFCERQIFKYTYVINILNFFILLTPLELCMNRLIRVTTNPIHFWKTVITEENKFIFVDIYNTYDTE